MGADVALTWDPDVSRVHAELARLADDWTVVDDGLSRNGTFINGERVEGRRRLFDGDILRCGETDLLIPLAVPVLRPDAGLRRA
jgi:pSer/pThr/pTyr-binding forkhead associated (FHA) protein